MKPLGVPKGDPLGGRELDRADRRDVAAVFGVAAAIVARLRELIRAPRDHHFDLIRSIPPGGVAIVAAAIGPMAGLAALVPDPRRPCYR